MVLQIKTFLISILLAALSLGLLICPTPQFLLDSPIGTTFFTGYIYNLSLDVLIGIFSSCLLAAIMSFITYKRLESELYRTFFLAIVQTASLANSLQNYLYLHTSTFKNDSDINNIELILYLYEMIGKFQTISSELAAKDITTLDLIPTKKNEKIYNIYSNNFANLMNDIIGFINKIEEVHVNIRKDMIDIQRETKKSISPDQFRVLHEQFFEGYVKTCVDFHDKLTKDENLKQLIYYVKNSKEILE